MHRELGMSMEQSYEQANALEQSITSGAEQTYMGQVAAEGRLLDTMQQGEEASGALAARAGASGIKSGGTMADVLQSQVGQQTSQMRKQIDSARETSMAELGTQGRALNNMRDQYDQGSSFMDLYNYKRQRVTKEAQLDIDYANKVYGKGLGGVVSAANQHEDEGGASRFFPVFRYEAKPSRAEKDKGLREVGMPERRGGSETFDPEQRDGTGEERMPLVRNAHPTVKALALMGWLCKLVTPPGGTILDPFLGSGSTAVAAQRLGFHVIGCEADPESVTTAEARVRGDQPLFAKVTVE